MQKFLFILALLACAVVARAQVTVEVLFDQEQFLRSESLPLRVRINNFSGQTLRLGEELDWLAFTVSGDDGKAMARQGNIPLPKPFTLDSAKNLSLRADLMPYFQLSEAGRYKVTARVKIPQLQSEVTSEPKTFDIISGAKIWEKDVGVPGTSPLVVRKFALQQATFLKQARLYARVTDAKEMALIRVAPLGPLTSFSRPEAMVDKSSQLHVLFQNGQRSFTYAIVLPDGELIIRQTYDIVGSSRPTLRQEDDGRMVVHGGQRRLLLSDLPPPPAPRTNEVGQGDSGTR
jgi:hypothetical protein